ncbi:aminopeptidase N [Exilibacterium tricleocarpae]|uniref:Aminopeptidase N n=1 Tax=Exilibacterium tricleocarpae TaxID=2591008 RepID=A0A545TV16_9GAMM|nr:aminopeptidase N [Exilibacterium tricleocarpae]TQV81001.1 aminopeptidase N [Exilibacterium tricleocarpae]
MKDFQPRAILLRDYRAPDYWIDKTDLHFSLAEEATDVTAELMLRRNAEAAAGAPLVLHGQDMELIEVAVDGRPLAPREYQLTDELLTLPQVPAQFKLTCKTRLKPAQNTSLEGLYKSHSMYCTQCEAEGFRKITYYLDRPDVMSEFTTTIDADRSRYPVLLSNGNLVDRGEGDGGRHWVRWHDPFKKPAYLFALVAGDLCALDDTFTTRSGREVTLRIFVEAKDLDKCDHAMASLKNAMAWDEKVYGREYDLDIFMIVAVDDFNMGAMENKGLNIFNTSCVLAKPETTTDAGFQRVEAVVAHEYFHNWSGNRVTCRDWFQLSLKEGFTVFRDAEFSADMGSPTVKRVEDVSLLRTLQFAEDAGPMSHPVQPASFIEISNFYTLTIYEKGAEVVRMLRNLLGAAQFRRGSDLYFERHDGQAVTIDDFVKAMEDASGRDLGQFKRWYSQAGTPVLEVDGVYDAGREEFTLTVSQSCPPTPDSETKLAFHIPLAVGLVGEAGPLALRLRGSDSGTGEADQGSCVLELTKPQQTFVFEGVAEKPVPSLLRGFSAPVKLHYDYSRDDLMRLMSRDSDGFCRWDASQQLGVAVIGDLIDRYGKTGELHREPADPRLLSAHRELLDDDSLDRAMVALMLRLPTEAYLSELADTVDVEAIHAARQHLRKALALALAEQWERVYHGNCSDEAYRADAGAIARRSLKNTALGYLALREDDNSLELCRTQFEQADNMTDVLAALACLVNGTSAAATAASTAALAAFYQRWQHEPLVVNQWLSVQAGCVAPGGLARVKALLQHPGFDIKNPNKVRALIGTFCNQNAINFHLKSGAGYRFLADQIIVLNRLNPQIAARMTTPLTKWQKYDPQRQILMKSELERILIEPDLSKDVYEVVSKSLR